MCEKVSFCQDKRGRILDAGGLTFSHSSISALHGLNDDGMNKYEFSPDNGLKVDKEVFVPKLSHVRKVELYIKKFKNKQFYERYGSKAKFMDAKVIGKIIPNGKKFLKYLEEVENIKWLSAKSDKLPLNILNLMKDYSKVIDGKDREIVLLSLSDSVAWSVAWSAARSAAESTAESAAWSAVRSVAESVAKSAVRSVARSAVRSAVESAARSAVRSVAVRSVAKLAVRSAVESVAESVAKSAAWVLFPKKLKNRKNIFEYYLKVAKAGYLLYKVSDDKIYILRK